MKSYTVYYKSETGDAIIMTGLSMAQSQQLIGNLTEEVGGKFWAEEE